MALICFAIDTVSGFPWYDADSEEALRNTPEMMRQSCGGAAIAGKSELADEVEALDERLVPRMPVGRADLFAVLGDVLAGLHAAQDLGRRCCW